MAIGAVLSQIGGDGQEHVIAYGSRLLTKSERQYCVTQRELLAVVVFTKNTSVLICWVEGSSFGLTMDLFSGFLTLKIPKAK